MEGVKSESPLIWNQARRKIGNSWLRFAVGGTLGVWLKGHCIEGRKTYSDGQAWGDGADSFHNLSQEACAIFEASAIRALARVCAEEFVTQVSMTMLDIHEIESQPPRKAGGAMKVLHDGSDFSVTEDGIIFWQFHPPIENWMVVQNAGITMLV